MKIPVVVLAVSTLAFGASSFYLWRQLDAQRAQAQAVQTANAALTARIAELQRLRAEFANLPPGAAGGHTSERADTPPSAQPPGGPAASFAWRSANRDDNHPPEMSEAMRKIFRTNMRARNRRLYFDVQSKLGLTDAQTSDLFDILSDSRPGGLKRPRLPDSDPEAGRADWEAEQAKRQAALEDLLGAAKAAQFAEYQKTMPSRVELMVISQQLEGAETPLDDTQRSRLLDALVAERERIPEPAYVSGTNPEEESKAYSDWQADYEKRVNEAARGILTSEQFNTLSDYQQWQREMRQQFAISGPAGGPPSGVAMPVTIEMSRRPTSRAAAPK